MLIKLVKKWWKIKEFIALKLIDVVCILLINVKMPAIDGILTFMSRINLSSAELYNLKKFYNLGTWVNYC